MYAALTWALVFRSVGDLASTLSGIRDEYEAELTRCRAESKVRLSQVYDGVATVFVMIVVNCFVPTETV